ncbi:MAG TPA: hypothetical protein VN959_01475, partial [Mycobacterium sp.]|nr:hypothetical protein [Mycobacterium sp.]
MLVSDELLQFWVGNELLKTVAWTSTGEMRKNRAGGTAKRTRMGSDCDTSTGGLTSQISRTLHRLFEIQYGARVFA